jgi:putative ATPase
MARKPPARSEQPTLLDAARARGENVGQAAPLAERMRPQSLGELVGQGHIVGAGKLLTDAISGDRIPSMILWGPPGSGKTTLARIVSHTTKSVFVPFSAVLGGVPELREILAAARERRAYEGRATTLFVDEIHRFNKAQQDAFLPHVEDGTITLVGATTENPSFAVNAAILSRCKVFHLDALGEGDIENLLRRALADVERGLGARRLAADDTALRAIAHNASGDARRGLGLLENAASLLSDGSRLDLATVERASEERTLLYDKSGEEHYNVVSALIKSMRGSDPDAAIYWLMRMLDAGDDPAFVLRRLIIFASEDVGNADPRALTIAVAADQAFHRLGMPEGLYPIAHACLYLATAPKSGSVGRAFKGARDLIRERGALPVPKKLRNAPTGLMKAEGYGEGYRYAHDYAGSHVPGETYLPDEAMGARFYEPSREGYEQTIAERLSRWRAGKESEK